MAGAATFSKPITSAASISKHINTLYSAAHSVTIYNTNDLHGNLYPVYGKFGGLLGIRKLLENQETTGLLLDAGDFLNCSQTLQQQKEVIFTMNKMGYHAATPGTQELASGESHLAILIPLMGFTMVNCNYKFNRELMDLIKPHLIIYSGKFKIGITGVGHQIDGIKYNDAILCANNEAALLKVKEKCDIVVCLSHLGFSQQGDQPDNQKLAQRSEHIDIIISGHNRNLLSGPSIILNKLKQEVIISHSAWDGLMLGKTTFCYTNKKQKSGIKAKYLIPGQPYTQTLPETFNGHREIEKHLHTA